MTRRVLLTGGLGFIGCHLARQLLDQDPEIELTIIDDLSGTVSDWSDLADRVTVHTVDLRTIAPGAIDFDELLHLASPVGSLAILGSSGHIAGDIIDLMSHACDLAIHAGASLLYISSSEVYGQDGRHGETADLIVPDRRGARMEYAIGKLGAEHVLHNRFRDSTLDYHIVRPFNCAGPGQSIDLGFVIPTFVRAALHGDPLPVHGDGTARRAFCHVDDMVAGMVAVFEAGRSGHVYNVGQPRGALTISELAARVIRRLGSPSTIAKIDPVQVYGHHWIEAADKIPDTTKVISDTGWAPTFDLDRIIDDVAAQIRLELPAPHRDVNGLVA